CQLESKIRESQSSARIIARAHGKQAGSRQTAGLRKVASGGRCKNVAPATPTLGSRSMSRRLQFRTWVSVTLLIVLTLPAVAQENRRTAASVDQIKAATHRDPN